jgi:hypothetical protein
MHHRTFLRACAATMATAGCVTALATAGGQPAGAATSSVSKAVSAALAVAAGPTATVDQSKACMGSSPQALVYTTNRVVLRTTKSTTLAEAVVRQALRDIHVSAGVLSTERITLPRPPTGGPVTPVLSVTLKPRSGEPVPVVKLARDLVKHHGTPAAPDYFLSPTSGPTGMWPFGYPVPAPNGLTPPRAGGQGSGITIAIYDTGLAAPAQNNIPANVTRLTSADTETLDASKPADGIVDLYFGDHNTAMAGVLNVIAPSASVEAVRITEANGVATDVSAARRMASTLKAANRAGNWPDVIVNAFGSPACALDPAHPGTDLVPLGLQAVDEAVDRIGQSLVVASAGNRSTSQRFYPAAFGSVVAIGALDTTADSDQSPWTSASRTGPRASFSNYGAWVDGWAPGVELPTNDVVGLRFEAQGPVINGAALVSGTSFAAPLAAGLIAERMATAGVDASTAWRQVAGSGVKCTAANGGGRAVALVDLTKTALTRATVARSPGDC